MGPLPAAAAPGGAMPAASRAARPAGLIRSELHGTSNVAVTSTGRPKAPSRSAIDALMSSSAGHPTKVGRISTVIGPSFGAMPTRWMIPRSTTDSIGSSGSITSVSAERTAASSIAVAAGARHSPAIAPARVRATPTWIPPSLTRSLPDRRGGRT